MSKKTNNIYKSLEKLSQLQNQLSEYNSTVDVRELKNIDFELGQEIKNLKFWIDSLYSLNGKSTSYAKKSASRENGKKGGRPPKAVTEARKRRRELEALIPELEHQLLMSDSTEERQNLEVQIEKYKKELISIEES